ncbi:MAG: carboxypeptidase regulatory-like domain-containing protein, partial [Gammaproteobacteria bacterium]|nr:carboxypeptidase regulatory-like domain-containing protein [Gammaproteobacteria bacterium]
MQRLGTVCSLLALGAMMSLTGCGSSGSDTGGESPGSQVPPPPVASGGDTISISGKVTDMPIANATVTVTVGGQTFTADAPTDAEGNYTVEISSDDPNAIVVLEATDSTGVHFTAVLDDFGGFEAKADSDGNVADTDITNVTTAHYLLATNASDDGSIDDADELDEVAGRIDPAAVLQLSAAIKLVVENIEGVALPDGVDNTQ